MKNHDKLLDHFQQRNSIEEFSYLEVFEIANEIIDATFSGKQYASLRFIQEYCNAKNVSKEKFDSFCKGDPRNNIYKHDAMNEWQYLIKKKNIEEKQCTERIPEINQIAVSYEMYSWNGKHHLFGYPADIYPEFRWIKSLEDRFKWLRENYCLTQTASIYLLKEMIQWGGSQNGVLQKFEDGCGEINLYEIMKTIIINIDDPEKALLKTLTIPGLGLTYATKLLRFLKPERYGALDSRIRKKMNDKKIISKIADGNVNSMISGYIEFLDYLRSLKEKLSKENIATPISEINDTGVWRIADIEMAVFCLNEK